MRWFGVKTRHHKTKNKMTPIERILLVCVAWNVGRRKGADDRDEKRREKKHTHQTNKKWPESNLYFSCLLIYKRAIFFVVVILVFSTQSHFLRSSLFFFRSLVSSVSLVLLDFSRCSDSLCVGHNNDCIDAFSLAPLSVFLIRSLCVLFYLSFARSKRLAINIWLYLDYPKHVKTMPNGSQNWP